VNGTLSPERIQQAADRLAAAERDRVAIDPLSETEPGLDLAGAYAVQRANVARRQAAGERLVGAKVGLTSEAMQTQLGVDQPDFGALFASMALPNGATLSPAELVAPRVEFEIAFVIARPLSGPDVSIADVMRATDAVYPTLEVIDSRIRDWKLQLVDTVADNASSARFVEPDRLTSPRGLDLRALGGFMEVNGRLVSHGAGAAVLGHPARCVAWLARTLHRFDSSLEAGDIVLSGALGPSVPLASGDVVSATIDRLGSVQLVASPSPEIKESPA
jgi:2-oxopent-4-enoate hydratase